MFNDFPKCVCPFLSTVSLSVWIRKLRDSIVTERQRERESDTDSKWERRRQRNKELYYFALSFIIFVNSAVGARVCLSPSVIKLTSVVIVNRASVHSNGSIMTK